MGRIGVGGGFLGLLGYFGGRGLMNVGLLYTGVDMGLCMGLWYGGGLCGGKGAGMSGGSKLNGKNFFSSLLASVRSAA